MAASSSLSSRPVIRLLHPALILACAAALACSGEDGGDAPPRETLTTLDLAPKFAPHVHPAGEAHAARHGDRGRFDDEWYAIDDEGGFAWARGARAGLALQVDDPTATELSVEVRPADFLGTQGLEVLVGDVSLGHRELQPGWQIARFDVPQGVLSDGFNAITLVADVEGSALERRSASTPASSARLAAAPSSLRSLAAKSRRTGQLSRESTTRMFSPLLRGRPSACSPADSRSRAPATRRAPRP